MTADLTRSAERDGDVIPAVPALVRRQSLSTSVYESLRQSITDGVLPPNYRLREIWLARHFGVSTTPVREALRRLEREGLVRISPHRGAVVAGFDLQAAANLYETRELLEVAATRRAAQNVRASFARARQILARMAEVAEREDQAEFNRLDVELHRAINDEGGNEVLADLAERVHLQIQSIRARAAVHLVGRPVVSHAEHLALLEALQRHDPDETERVIRLHVNGVRDKVLAALRGEARPR